MMLKPTGKVYASTVRTNIDITADLLKTERQWAKCGYVAKNNDCGTMLWSNCNCSKKYRYLHKDEVRPATTEELTEYFRPEKEKAAKRKKEKREQLRLERERKNARNRLRKVALTEMTDDSVLKSKVIVIDTETTGIDSDKDELLQVSIISDKGITLYNNYFKPKYTKSWKSAQAVNGISPEMTVNCSHIDCEVAKINAIISSADTIIGYNIYFDLNFLAAVGCEPSEKAKIIDVMKGFAELYDECSDYHGRYKCQKLSTCANYYGYDWGDSNAHNSLADCLATLFCYKRLTAESKELKNDKS